MITEYLETVREGGAACFQRVPRLVFLIPREHTAIDDAILSIVHSRGDIGRVEYTI